MEQFEIDAYKQLNDLYSTPGITTASLTKNPLEAMNGSRTMTQQDARVWGVENLSGYLLNNNGDPYGILDPNAVKSFLDPINARKQELSQRDPYLNYGAETEPSNVFSNFTTPQLQAYLDRLNSYYMAAGNPGNDAMWIPTLQGNNVVWGQKNGAKGGFLDKLSDYVGPALMAGVGAMSGGFGLSDLLKGAGALEAVVV